MGGVRVRGAAQLGARGDVVERRVRAGLRERGGGELEVRRGVRASARALRHCACVRVGGRR